VNLAQSCACDSKVALGLAAAFGGGIAEARGNQAFGLQAFKCRVDAAHRYVAAAMRFKLATDGHTVGFFFEADDSEEDHELELSEVVPVCH
jgi:hypothetical protein